MLRHKRRNGGNERESRVEAGGGFRKVMEAGRKEIEGKRENRMGVKIEVLGKLMTRVSREICMCEGCGESGIEG